MKVKATALGRQRGLTCNPHDILWYTHESIETKLSSRRPLSRPTCPHLLVMLRSGGVCAWPCLERLPRRLPCPSLSKNAFFLQILYCEIAQCFMTIRCTAGATVSGPQPGFREGRQTIASMTDLPSSPKSSPGAEEAHKILFHSLCS